MDADGLLPRYLLEELKADFEEARGDKINTLLVMLRFFKDIGIDEALLKPLDEVRDDWLKAALHGPNGGRARPLSKTLRLANAAAAVAILVNEEGYVLADALREVGKVCAPYPNADEIQNFRNELSRGRGSRVVRTAYKHYFENMARPVSRSLCHRAL